MLTAARTVAAQTGGATVRITDIALSADTVGLGDLVDLSFQVHLAPGTLAFLPDSLESSAFESIEPVRWTATEGTGGVTVLSVTYPLIAFQVGGVAVPEFPVFVGRGAEAANAGFANADDLVGTWSRFREEPSAVPSARAIVIPAQALWVATVLDIEDASNGVQPRPIADTLGGERDWLSTILTLVFGSVLLWVLGTAVAAGVRLARERNRPVIDPRTATLTALDALYAEGPHRSGDIRGFYARASDIARRFVERLDDAWGPAHTSTELMSHLDRAARAAAVSDVPPVEPLAGTMDHAEVVKFGGDRPGPEDAEEDWQRLRDWVEGSGPPV